MTEVKKVCHVMRRFNKTKWGGTESAVHNISKQFNALGVESPIFCTDMFADAGDELFDEVLIRRYSYSFPWFFLSEEDKLNMRLKGGSPLSFSMFYALLREKNLSVVHTHVQNRLGGIARTVARLRRVPLIVSVHAGYLTLPAEHSEEMMKPFLGKPEWGKAFGFLLGSRKTMDDADGVICVGQDECARLRDKYPNKNIQYIPNGVDVEFFRNGDGRLFREEQGISSDEKLLMCISRIDNQKNQLLLVKAFKTFARRHPGYTLVLIGPVTVRSYYDEIISVAREEGLEDRIRIIEGLPPDDPMLASAYSAAKMFILPSSIEPFGIVILEAWAAGVPVVASNVGGIPGFTADGDNILHFDNGNEEMLIAQMERIVTDPSVERRLIAGGEKAVAGYDWKAIAPKILDLYGQAIETKNSSV